MRLLITGGAGQVGSEFQTYDNCYRLTHAECDITDSNSIAAAIKDIQPTMIINTAAYNAVDKAETEIELANTINCLGPKLLAEQAKANSIILLHMSTDYVFAGDKTSPYTEDDKVNPINAYGQSKLAGEAAVRNNLSKHIILRVSSIFGIYGNNFVKAMINLARKGQAINIVNDKVSCPTAASNIAKAIMTIAKQVHEPGFQQFGTYHYADSDILNWYDFANMVFELYPGDDLILDNVKAVDSNFLARAADRPAYSAMSSEKLGKVFGITAPSCREALRVMLQQLTESSAV